ncbi:MAG: transglycosylase domain-containing protein [Actinobacteria bacterium]|nr:transglycosylase domain-containing protein [Actinomycetota bacterium]
MPEPRPSFRPLAPWQALLALPLVIALAATTLGVLTLPALATADGAIGTVRDELLDLPPLPDVVAPAERSRMYDSGGNFMGYLVGAENRDIVPLDRIPERVRQAVIATEDDTFYEHNGVNRAAIMRAMMTNVQSGDIEQGASTITQQYVKNAMLSNAQTLERKLQEAIYATRLERELSKDEILERYLNLAYFGSGAYGVAAAAERYFGVGIEDVTLGQAAMLAGMIRLPEVNNPIRSPEAALARRDVVLRQMRIAGFITPEEEQQASTERWDPERVTEPPAPPHPFFVEYVKKLLLDHPALGETRQERIDAVFGGGLRIHTTLDQRMQTLANQAIADHLQDPVEHPLGGLLSLEADSGQIRTMALGPKEFGSCEEHPDDCHVTKVNPLVPGMGGSGRQVGSSIKPIVDTAALDAGLRTSFYTSVRDGKEIPGCIDYKDGEKGLYRPVNYSPTGGSMDMPEALRRSNNVYHATVVGEIGPQTVGAMANRMGIGSVPADYPHCSIGLGAIDAFPIEMASAFATLANGGVACVPYAITEVTDADGNVLIAREPSCERVVDQEIADKLVTMMQAVVESGTATAAQIGRPVAGKTGTTNDFKDAWFVGFTPQLVTAAWVGFEIPREMYGVLGHRRVTGGSIPAQLWHDYMLPTMEPFEVEALPRVPLDRYTPPKPKPKPQPADEPPDEPADQPADPPADEPPPDAGDGNGGNGGGNGDGGGD